MKIRQTLNRHPLIFSIVIGMVVLFMRCWTLPHSFLYLRWHVLLATVLSIAALKNLEIDIISSIPFSIIITIITVIFFVIFANSLRHFIQSRNKKKVVIQPLLINIITILFVIYGNYFVILPDFYTNLKSMQEVVEMVKSGKLTLSNPRNYNYNYNYNYESVDGAVSDYTTYRANLPTKYKNLSTGDIRGERKGKIYIVKEKDNQIKLIIFIRSGGTDPLGHRYTAFMYKSQEKSINHEDIWVMPLNTPLAQIVEAKKLITLDLNPYEDNWFWVDVYED